MMMLLCDSGLFCVIFVLVIGRCSLYLNLLMRMKLLMSSVGIIEFDGILNGLMMNECMMNMVRIIGKKFVVYLSYYGWCSFLLCSFECVCVVFLFVKCLLMCDCW